MSTSAHQPGETEYHANTEYSPWHGGLNLKLFVYISDSPQVQCIQSYSSQEPDELSIEMADVLNLLERTDDGG